MSEPINQFSLGTTTLAPSGSAISPSHPRRRSRWWVFGVALLTLVGVVLAFLIFTGTRFAQALQFENTPISFFEGVRLVGASLIASPKHLAGYKEGRINILLLGRAGEKHPGKHLTDTVMLLSIDTKEKRVALLSLPRDLLVPLPDTPNTVKINTLYQYGLRSRDGADLVKQSVGTITGLPIHYFATIDFDGFEQVIDTLGGIQIDVVRDIYDTRYPGKNYSYETFELKQGWQKLDGKTALKYARVRHGDPEGDFGRAKRQQQILQAVRDRAWSLPTFLNPITLTRLLESLGDSVDTDITPEAARSLLTLAETIDTKEVSTVVVDAWKKASLLRVTHIESSSGRAFALVPRSGTWNEVGTLAKNIFQADSIEKRRDQIEEERATLLILVSPRQLSLGNDLATDIRDTFPVKEVIVRAIPSLENSSGNGIIETLGNLEHIYTLDSLIARYALERRETLPLSLPPRLPEHDLLLWYTRDTIPGLQYEAPPEDMGDFAESQ